MWWTDYLREINRQFVEVYGMEKRTDCPDIPEIVPKKVPDGEYPMTINGRLDNVRVVDGKISCCNFEKKTK